MRAVKSKLIRRKAASEEAFSSSKRTWKEREGLLLVIYDEYGRVGLGEASPLPGYSNETVDECAVVLKDIHQKIGPIDLKQETAANIADSFCDIEVELKSCPSARFALETALFDIVGKIRGCSVSSLLSNSASYGSLQVNGLVSLDKNPEALTESARRQVEEGYRVIKVKGGHREIPLKEQICTLASLRKAVGEKIELRLDVNGAWSVDEADVALKELEFLKLEFLEEPVADGRIKELVPCKTAIAADESLVESSLVEMFLEREVPEVFVLKPALLGGLIYCYDLGEIASGLGKKLVVSHMFDGPVALAACCELAFSFTKAPLACGLKRHGGLGIWPKVDVAKFEKNGIVNINMEPGLGIDDKRFLEAL